MPSMVVTAVKRIKVFQHSQLKQMARELRTLYSCSAATEISEKESALMLCLFMELLPTA